MNVSVFIHDTYLYITFGGMCFLVALSAVVGAVFGSFFNVVAYRLPRGMSLSTPPSHCPKCKRPIRWYDNVPILGWIMLGGRCRACKSPISPRYPLVELLVAAATTLVSWQAIALLPGSEAAYTLDFALVGFRLLLVYALFCAALVEFDAQGAPLKLLAVVLVAGSALPLIWPELRPPAAVDFDARIEQCVIVLAAGLLLGLLAWPVLLKTSDRAGIRDAVAGVIALAAVGAFLGLAALMAIAVFAAALRLLTNLFARFWPPSARVGWAVGLLAGTLVWIAVGPQIDARWLAERDLAATFVLSGIVVAALALAGRFVRKEVRGTD